MSRMLNLAVLALFALGNSAICEAQNGPLRVVGVDGKAHEITSQEWAQLPRAKIKVVDYGGAEATFEGVPASALLKFIGVPLGSELRGKNLSLYVVAEGA